MQRLLLAALAGCLCLSACRKSPEPTPAEVPGPGKNVSEPNSPAPPGQTEENLETAPSDANVTLTVRDWDSTLALLRDQTGKVVVADIWTTTCPPCIREFPNLVQLQRDYPEQVACFSISADYAGFDDEPVESYEPKVLAFLQEHDATFDNTLLSTDSETLFKDKIEHNSIPVVFVFDQQGELAGQFPDPQDPHEFSYAEHVRPLVEQLLAHP